MTDQNTGIIQIHGRNYHTVAKRLADWRKDHTVKEGWMVMTEILDRSNDHCLVKAQLVNPSGVTIATGHALERLEYLSNGMLDSLVEVAETSAVGRALAFAGFGGGGEIASADEMQRRAVPARIGPKRLRAVVEAIRVCIDKQDGPGLIQIKDEWEEDEWLYIWGTLQSWEKTAAKALAQAAYREANRPDPNYIDPTPLENDRADKEASRRAANV